MEQYPKFIYHKSLAPKIVNTKEEQDAQGPEWEETPAAFTQESSEKASEQTQDQAAAKQNEALKNKDFLKMKVAELKEIALEKGASEEQIDGLKKDELIALIGSL